MTSRFKHISQETLDEFREILSRVIYEYQHTQHRLQISMQTPVDNPLEMIAMLNRQSQLRKKGARPVKRARKAQEGKATFNVINVYVRTAQEPELTAEEQYKLEKVAGNIFVF